MEILIPTSTTSWEHQLQLNTMCRAETFSASFFCQNSPRMSADGHLRTFRGDRNSFQHFLSQNFKGIGPQLSQSNLLWPLENFGDIVSEGPQKLQETTASLTQLRPDSFENLAKKVLEGVSVSSECLQVAVSAYSRTVLTKKNFGKCLCPAHCVQLQLVLPTSG